MLLYGYRFEHKRTRSKAPIQQKQISKMGCRGAMSPGLFHRPDGETWVGNGEEGCQFHQPTHEVAGCLSVLATASLATSGQGGYWIWIKTKRKILRKQGRNQSAFLAFLISAQGCFPLSSTAWPVSITTHLVSALIQDLAFHFWRMNPVEGIYRQHAGHAHFYSHHLGTVYFPSPHQPCTSSLLLSILCFV